MSAATYPKKLHSVPWWAEHVLGCSRQTAYRRIARNELGGVVRMGNSLYIDPELYDEWRRNGGTPPHDGAQDAA